LHVCRVPTDMVIAHESCASKAEDFSKLLCILYWGMPLFTDYCITWGQAAGNSHGAPWNMDLPTPMIAAGSLKESVLKIYTRQILTGLEYLHAHQIMHRDIKGANILVDNTGLIKLADFGASKKIEDLVTLGREALTNSALGWFATGLSRRWHMQSVLWNLFVDLATWWAHHPVGESDAGVRKIPLVALASCPRYMFLSGGLWHPPSAFM
jgi:hypothetical protein